MVLYLNSVLQANLPVGVSCIKGRSLEMGGGLPFSSSISCISIRPVKRTSFVTCLTVVPVGLEMTKE